MQSIQILRSLIANMGVRYPKLTQAGIKRHMLIQSLNPRISNTTQTHNESSNDSFSNPITSYLRRRTSANLISLPNRKLFPTPYDDCKISITTLDGERLHGFFLPTPYQEYKNKVVIFLQGGDENSTVWVHAASHLQEEVPASYLVVGYRGFGRNTGKTSIEGFQIDTRSMYSKLLELDFQPENISVYGRSMGGALAVELASAVKVRSLAVQSSFSSFENYIIEQYPWLPLSFVDTNYLNSRELITHINDDTPILIGHGNKDRLVGVHHAEELYRHANEPKKLIVLAGAGHVRLKKYFTREYFEALREMVL